MVDRITFRPATEGDTCSLRALHASSIRALGRGFYECAAIEAFLAHVDTLDEALIDDGTYFVAEVAGVLAGCGGWTGREPSYASYLGAHTDGLCRRATVRSVYVHPQFAGHGIARTLMERIEASIAVAGFPVAALEATLNAVPFYRRLGYGGDSPAVFHLPQGRLFIALSMQKQLSPPGRTC